MTDVIRETLETNYKEIENHPARATGKHDYAEGMANARYDAYQTALRLYNAHYIENFLNEMSRVYKKMDQRMSDKDPYLNGYLKGMRETYASIGDIVASNLKE